MTILTVDGLLKSMHQDASVQRCRLICLRPRTAREWKNALNLAQRVVLGCELRVVQIFEQIDFSALYAAQNAGYSLPVRQRDAYRLAD